MHQIVIIQYNTDIAIVIYNNMRYKCIFSNEIRIKYTFITGEVIDKTSIDEEGGTM